MLINQLEKVIFLLATNVWIQEKTISIDKSIKGLSSFTIAI